MALQVSLKRRECGQRVSVSIITIILIVLLVLLVLGFLGRGRF